MKKILSVIFSAILITFLGVNCFANSGLSYWQGSSNGGSIVFDKECPIEVEKEKLFFDIPELPSTYYESTEDFLNYKANVTAQYTFVNPADYDVTATLSFPFGTIPSYAYYDDFSVDTEKYDVTINNNKIKKKLRHTLFTGYDFFDFNEEGKKLCDTYQEDEFYSPDMPVKVYVYEAKIDEKSSPCYISTSFSNSEIDGKKTKIMLSDSWGHEYKDNKVFTGLNAEQYSSIYLYVIGEDIKSLPEWSLYKDSSMDKEIKDGSVELLFTDDRTFKDIATMFHLEETTYISEVDWYNATVDYLNRQTTDEFFLGSDVDIKFSPYQFMRWYQYDIEIGAGEKILNTVTAPLYPAIDEGYEPEVYEYNYLLSPAKSWRKFGKLDIEIKTPYNLVKNNLGKFEKDVESHTISLDTLPGGDLNFKLSTVDNPKKIWQPIYIPYEILVLIVIIMAAVIIIMLVIIIVLLVKRKKNKK